jgi:4-hydroxy-tetrahydrodipicolinate synthase
MITGSIVAIVTPLTVSGELDMQTMTNILEWHVDQGTDAIVAVGTTGESATISVPEHCKVVEHVVAVVDGRIPVIAGTGANSTTEAVELTKAAQNAGADACLLVTPYYNRPNQKGLYEHFRVIAETVDIPQILYNVPGRTACDMLPETIFKLSGLENIVGVKEATGLLERGKEVMSLCDDDFAVYSGDDGIAMDLMLAGARGNISVTANVAPKLMHELCELAMSGQDVAARLVNDKVESLHKNLFVESNPIPVKWAMLEMGLIGPGIRLPMVGLDERYHETLRLSMQQAGVI